MNPFSRLYTITEEESSSQQVNSHHSNDILEPASPLYYNSGALFVEAQEVLETTPEMSSHDYMDVDADYGFIPDISLNFSWGAPTSTSYNLAALIEPGLTYLEAIPIEETYPVTVEEVINEALSTHPEPETLALNNLEQESMPESIVLSSGDSVENSSRFVDLGVARETRQNWQYDRHYSSSTENLGLSDPDDLLSSFRTQRSDYDLFHDIRPINSQDFEQEASHLSRLYGNIFSSRLSSPNSPQTSNNVILQPNNWETPSSVPDEIYRSSDEQPFLAVSMSVPAIRHQNDSNSISVEVRPANTTVLCPPFKPTTIPFQTTSETSMVAPSGTAPDGEIFQTGNTDSTVSYIELLSSPSEISDNTLPDLIETDDQGNFVETITDTFEESFSAPSLIQWPSTNITLDPEVASQSSSRKRSLETSPDSENASPDKRPLKRQNLEIARVVEGGHFASPKSNLSQTDRLLVTGIEFVTIGSLFPWELCLGRWLLPIVSEELSLEIAQEQFKAALHQLRVNLPA